MATKKLTDYFSVPTLPLSGGFSIANSTPAMLPKKPVAAPAPDPLSVLNLNNVGRPPVTPVPISLSSLKDTIAIGPNGSVVPRATVAPSPSASPVYTPPSGGPAAAPVGPQGATGAAPASQSPIPPQYLNPDGSLKTPEEVAASVGGIVKAAHGNGDVGTLALEQFGGQGKSAADLEAEARRIGNTRNDIAVGETDPYKVASQSGIAYTPAELAAIEKAYAGVYDPALDTALAKVNAKQEQDKLDAQNNQPFTLGKDQVRYDKDGNPIAVGISSSDGAPGGTYVKGQNAVVDAYVEGSKNGTYKPSDIPDQYKDLVAQGLAQTKPNISKSSNDAISIINELVADPNINNLSGFRVLNPSSLFPGTDIQTTQNLAKQLKGVLSLENRTQLKGQGAISDFEFRVLGDAASALGIDDNGRTNLSPENFKAQLNKLELKLQVGETNLTDDELLYLQGKGYTPDQIRAYDDSSGKVSVGNTTASTGNIPQRNNNPGNVKAGGLADSLAVGKDKYGHLIFPDAQTGFKALTADLTAKINGGSARLPKNPTIAQLGKVYAEDPNWPIKVAAILGVPVDTHTAAVPLANLVKAVAVQEGFYA